MRGVGTCPDRACRAAQECSGPAALGHWGACTIGQAAGPGLGGCGFYFAEAAQAFHHPQASGITFCRRHSQQVSRLLCGPSLINQLLTCTYWVSPLGQGLGCRGTKKTVPVLKLSTLWWGPETCQQVPKTVCVVRAEQTAGSRVRQGRRWPGEVE